MHKNRMKMKEQILEKIRKVEARLKERKGDIK
jgi:hypothetical protein